MTIASTAIAIGAVAVVLAALSLNHLTTGIEIITHASGWEAMALAVGVDLGFVALELSQLAIGDKLRRQSASMRGRLSSAPWSRAPP